MTRETRLSRVIERAREYGYTAVLVEVPGSPHVKVTYPNGTADRVYDLRQLRKPGKA